jgi:aspartyl-tRNA(Asn)/glutamyl-tRNA(Gln) amidotransferase subunit C
MSIDLKTLRRVAELARLDVARGLPEAEALAAEEKLAAELSGLVGRVDILAEADTANVEPLYSLMSGEIPGDRPDVPRPSGLTEEFLAQAPDRIGDFFAVPKIM